MGVEIKKLETFFKNIADMESDEWMAMVEQHLDDRAIETFVQHIEDFYGIEDDEELGQLAQLMITGFIAGRTTVTRH